MKNGRKNQSIIVINNSSSSINITSSNCGEKKNFFYLYGNGHAKEFKRQNKADCKNV